MNIFSKMNVVNEIKNFDYNSKNAKYASAFLIPAVIFFVLSPGVIVEINPRDEKKVKMENKINYVSALVHSIIFGILMFVFYYFYLGKMPSGVYRAAI